MISGETSSSVVRAGNTASVRLSQVQNYIDDMFGSGGHIGSKEIRRWLQIERELQYEVFDDYRDDDVDDEVPSSR